MLKLPKSSSRDSGRGPAHPGASAASYALAAPVFWSQATGASMSASGRGASIPKQFFWLLDLVTLAAAFVCAYALTPSLQALVAPGGPLRAPWLEWLRLPTIDELEDWRPFAEVAWMFAVMAPTTLLFIQVLGGYRAILSQSRVRILVSSVFGPLAGLGTISLVLFAVKYHRASRLLMFSFAVLSALGCLASRLVLRAHKRRRLLAGDYAQDVAIVGPAASVAQLSAYFDRHVSKALYRVAGYLRLTPAEVVEPAEVDGAVPAAPPTLLGDVSELSDILIHRPIHEVVAVLPAETSGWLESVVEACGDFHVTLRIIPEALLARPFQDLMTPTLSGAPGLPQIVLTPKYFDADALFLKRIIDIVVSATLLVALSPLFALIALAIKLTTPHLPVFYPWRVVGYKGRQFTGYKFTTMEADAEARRQELMHLNEMSGPVFKIKADPRVTPLGRILRKFSLNELPQLWSVLKGDMSLVGPRPAFPHELPRYELWQKRKLAVQPGITCLWQVRGRNQISNFDEWVRMDLEYIDRWSLRLDFEIMLRTVWAVVAGTGS